MNGDDFYLFDLQLSERETFFVGKIVTLWGALEYEIFNQTLLTYDEEGMSVDKLPKALKGQQFSDILDLWYERVVANAKPKPRRVLEDQYKAITHYQTYRNALVHGMLDYVATDLGSLVSMRVKKKELVTVQFYGGRTRRIRPRLAPHQLQDSLSARTKSVRNETQQRGVIRQPKGASYAYRPSYGG